MSLFAGGGGARPSSAAVSASSSGRLPPTAEWANAVLQKGLPRQLVGSKRNLLTAAGNSQAPDWLPPASKIIPLKISSDGLHYLMTLGVGTPQQQLSVIVDTGSGDLMLFNSSLCSARGMKNECFQPSRSSSFVLEPGQRPWNIFIDNEVVGDSTSVPGKDMVVLQVAVPGTQAHVPLLHVTPLVVSSNFQQIVSDRAWHTFPDNDGLLGLSYSILSGNPAWPAALMLLLPESEVVFAPILSFDFNGGEHSSQLGLGGIAEEYRDQLDWSPPVRVGDYHRFTVYDLSVCGQDLFGGVASSWGALLDTGSSCLSLPEEFFDSLVARLPVQCEDKPQFPAFDSHFSLGRVCYLPQNLGPGLPSLSFRISPDGPLLHVSLTDLLVQDPFHRKRLCVVRGVSYQNTADLAPISFGSRVLQSVYVASSMSTWQVGMATKAHVHPSARQCVVQEQCVGMQTRYEPWNTCVDPNCADYYFFETHEESKTCRLSARFYWISVVCILLFASVELGLNELHRFLGDKTVHTVPQATP